MCDFTQGIKLCSCNSDEIQFREEDLIVRKKGKTLRKPNPKNAAIPEMYIWILDRIRSSKNGLEMGNYMFPVDDLGNGLDSDWITLNLNDHNCFDFDYKPETGDTLIIRKNKVAAAYISFVWDGCWKVDHHSPFDYNLKNIGKGKVE